MNCKYLKSVWKFWPYYRISIYIYICDFYNYEIAIFYTVLLNCFSYHITGENVYWWEKSSGNIFSKSWKLLIWSINHFILLKINKSSSSYGVYICNNCLWTHKSWKVETREHNMAFAYFFPEFILKIFRIFLKFDLLFI